VGPAVASREGCGKTQGQHCGFNAQIVDFGITRKNAHTATIARRQSRLLIAKSNPRASKGYD